MCQKRDFKEILSHEGNLYIQTLEPYDMMMYQYLDSDLIELYARIGSRMPVLCT